MNRLRIILSTAVLVLYTVVTCQAHEGHGHENPLSPGHYIASPEHALPIALTLITALAGGWLIYKTAARARRK